MKINVGDTYGICASCDGSTIDDRMLKYHQSSNNIGNARLGIISQPDMFVDTRSGGRLDDARVSDFVMNNPGQNNMQRLNIVADRPKTATNLDRDTSILAPRQTQIYTDGPVQKDENPFLNRLIPKDTVFYS